MGCSCSSSLEDLAADPDLDLDSINFQIGDEEVKVAGPHVRAPESDASTVASEGDSEEGKRGAVSRFQIRLGGRWENYCAEEDAVLKRAYLVGHPRARYHLRGQDYEYSFEAMKQINLGTGKERRIRPPRFMRPPKAPLLPPGSMVVVTVPEGAAGGTMGINDPNNAGQTLEVFVPAGAVAGAKMAAPVPQKGETAADVRKRQEDFSSRAGVAMGAAAAGALVLGGAILGDHLTGGEASGRAEEWAAGEAAGWVEGAAEDTGDWVEGAAEDTCRWAPGAAEDADAWAHCAAEDVAVWLACAAEDASDFVMDLF